MENASKALIIAGSIILAVLIIVLGMFFYNNAKSSGNNLNMSEYDVQQFNEKFTKYESQSATGAEAKALCDVVLNHNLANKGDSTKQVEITTDTATDGNAASAEIEASTITAVKNGIKEGRRYTINVGYDNDTGLVYKIGIKTNTTTSTPGEKK